MPSWKLDPTDCPSVNSDYGESGAGPAEPFKGPDTGHRGGCDGGWGGWVGYSRWEIELCMLQCSGHKSKFTI